MVNLVPPQGPSQSLHRKASDTFARLVMSCPFYKAITSSYETPRDWNFTFLHHLYVSRYLLWQIAIPHPMRSDLPLPPCFSVFEQKMTVNKGRLVKCKRKSIIPSKWFSHIDLLFASTLNALYTKAKSTEITYGAKCTKIMCMILKVFNYSSKWDHAQCMVHIAFCHQHFLPTLLQGFWILQLVLALRG